MPDRLYNLIYKGDNTDLVQKTQQLIGLLQQLDQVATNVAAKLKNYSSGSGRSTSAAARGAQKLAAQINAVTAAATTAQSALTGMGTAAGQAAARGRGLKTSLGGLTGTLVGLNELRRVIRMIADALKDARQYARETGEENLKLMNSLREVANLSGRTQPDTQTAAETVKLMLTAGMEHPEEARDFQQGFKEAFFAVRNKGNLKPTAGTPEQLEQDIMNQAARISVAKGIAPRTTASLAAVIGIGKPITSKEQVGAELGLTIQNLNEGIGSLSALSDQVLRARGALISQGYAQSIPDVAAMISGMSINNPAGRTATRVESMVSSVSKAVASENGKATSHDRDIRAAGAGRRKGFAPGEGPLAKLGITADNRDFIDILRRLKPVIDKANAPGGQGALAALSELGITENRAQNEFIKSVGELPLYEAQIAKNRAILGDSRAGIPANQAGINAAAASLNKDLDKFHDEDTTGRVGGARLFAANWLRGLKTQRLAVHRRNAAADLISKNRIKTPSQKVESLIVGGFGLQEGLGGKSDEEMLIDHQVATQMLARARQAGISDAWLKSHVSDLWGAAQGTRGNNPLLDDARFGMNVQLLEDRLSGKKGGGRVLKDQLNQQSGKTLEQRVNALTIPEPGGAAPAAAAGPVPGHASADPRQDRIQTDQLTELKGIRSALASLAFGSAAGVDRGPIGATPLPGGPVRIGDA